MKAHYLDQRLLDLGGGSYVTYRDLAQNVLVTGAISSGKSSGPGAHILTALARSDAGGIILCAKSSEAEDVYAILKKAGREHSVIVWNGRNGGFNFLAWALARMGTDGIGSVVEYLVRVIEIVRNAGALRGSDGESFWIDEFKRALRHMLLPIYLATGTLTMASILAFLRSAPTSIPQFSDAEWQSQRPFFFECFRLAADRIDGETGAQLLAYWREYASMDGKLRTSILATFTMLDRFCHGWMKQATTADTTLVPALCFHGAIIILDMSRTTMGEDGVITQMIFKDAFQTEVLARNSLPPQHRARFVFCYADEAQEFWTVTRDAEFFAMSRSSYCSTVYLTQSLNSIYAKFGGSNAHDQGLHAVASMGVRVHCANNCTTTNTWAAESLGKAVQYRASFNENSGSNTSYGYNMGLGTNEGESTGWGGSSGSSSGAGGSSSSSSSSWNAGRSSGSNASRGRNQGGGESYGTSRGLNETMELIVEPGYFTRLKTGGPANGNRVSALWTQMGRIFPSTGLPFTQVEFAQ